ncbi:CinA-like protein [Raoultella terrigena]|uniref:CinA-like protein n=1 Tax=Raoultella terrigena TaxID=577 RepID=A0A4U9CXA4_RAOTE|nr:CinA-like protein [Raoultella terrigena]
MKHFAGLALAVCGQEADYLNFVLSTPEGTHALRVKLSVTRYSLQVRQEVCAMMALNMLRPLAERPAGSRRSRLD